ncbi:MAG: sigma 54-interacting transcriptional regulator [Planctomycetaceae bacterium]
MDGGILVYVQSEELAGQLSVAVASSGLQVNCMTHPDDVCDVVRTSSNNCLIVDVRPKHLTDETVKLLRDLLAESIGRLHLITLGSNDWPTQVAAECEQLSATHITCRVGWERDTTTLDQLRQAFVDPSPSFPKPVHRFDTPSGEFLTCSTEMATLYDRITRVARINATVLLTGESGTGKTTLARMIHDTSDRSGHPFLKVSCGGLPMETIDSELFGQAGDTGSSESSRRIGRFEATGQGTLLLDDLDLLPLHQQGRLLRVLESGEYEPVGATQTQVNQARLVAASHIDLAPQCQKGAFRADLYYRLNVLELEVPALRQRTEDIPSLAVDMLEEIATQQGRPIGRISRDVFHALRRYHWPGNLRELKHVIQRAVLFADDGRITIHQLPTAVRHAGLLPEGSTGDHSLPGIINQHVEKTERELLEQTLRACHYNRSLTAATLGISRAGLYKRIDRLGILLPEREAG